MYVTLDTVGEKINVLECFNRAVENTQLKHRKENGKYSQKKKKIDIEYVTKKVSQYPVKFLIYVEFKYGRGLSSGQRQRGPERGRNWPRVARCLGGPGWGQGVQARAAHCPCVFCTCRT